MFILFLNKYFSTFVRVLHFSVTSSVKKPFIFKNSFFKEFSTYGRDNAVGW